MHFYGCVFFPPCCQTVASEFQFYWFRSLRAVYAPSSTTLIQIFMFPFFFFSFFLFSFSFFPFFCFLPPSVCRSLSSGWGGWFLISSVWMISWSRCSRTAYIVRSFNSSKVSHRHLDLLLYPETFKLSKPWLQLDRRLDLEQPIDYVCRWISLSISRSENGKGHVCVTSIPTKLCPEWRTCTTH